MTRKPRKIKHGALSPRHSAKASARRSKLPRRNMRSSRGQMIGVADLDDIAVGGAILGTGGGGDPYIGKLMAQQAIRKYGPVRLIDVDQMKDDEFAVPCAMMGAPTLTGGPI